MHGYQSRVSETTQNRGGSEGDGEGEVGLNKEEKKKGFRDKREEREEGKRSTVIKGEGDM